MSYTRITIYTDGSCKPNPGPGGWGAVIVTADGGTSRTLKGSDAMSTNNRMELMAPIEALRSLANPHEIILITDSTYVKNGITKWIHDWKQRDWLTREGLPVKNKDLWEILDREMQRHRITWEWVKGHAGNRWNELADSLASSFRDNRSLPVNEDAVVHMYIGITCKHATGSGSWALILNYRQHLKILGGKVEDTTANRLYLQTALKGFKALKRSVPVYIYTTSGYLCDGANDWLSGWVKRGWMTREGKEVSNKEQWQELKSFIDIFDVRVLHAEKNALPCLLQEAKELAREYADDG